jgi:hypothetical protein
MHRIRGREVTTCIMHHVDCSYATCVSDPYTRFSGRNVNSIPPDTCLLVKGDEWCGCLLMTCAVQTSADAHAGENPYHAETYDVKV